MNTKIIASEILAMQLKITQVCTQNFKRLKSWMLINLELSGLKECLKAAKANKKFSQR